MKELSLEAKAKAYDEAFKVAQKLYQDCPNGKNDRLYHTTDLEKMFPELKVKESEDERIRKELIEYVKDQQSSFISAPDCRDKYEEEENNKYNSWLNWLEKQKPAQNINKEDEEVRQYIIRTMEQKDINVPMVKKALSWLEKQGKKELVNFDEAEKEKREFVGDGFIECHADFLDFKEGNTYWLEYIGDDEYNVRSDNLLGKTYHITPCQLYTVFKKLTWIEKQGGKKIDWNPQPGDIFRKKGTISPTYHLCGKREDGITFCFVEKREVGISGGEITIFALRNDYELVERPKTMEKIIEEEFNKVVCPNDAWSEEDENTIKVLMNIIRKSEMIDSIIYTDSLKEKLYDWLKSLKPRNMWKPSDEQMDALNCARWNAPFNIEILDSLYNDLKKLKE